MIALQLLKMLELDSSSYDNSMETVNKVIPIYMKHSHEE